MSDKFTLDVAQAVEIKHAFDRNGGTNADIKELCKGDAVAKLLPFLRGRAEIVVKSILTFLRTWTASPQPAVTTSVSYFEEAGVTLMGNNFKDQFIGLEVPETVAQELSVDKFEEDSLDAPILSQLGDKAETAVSQFRDFLDKHRESTGRFIFYLRGKDGNLWAVGVKWSADSRGWDVYADSISSSYSWSAGRQVVSCK